MDRGDGLLVRGRGRWNHRRISWAGIHGRLGRYRWRHAVVKVLRVAVSRVSSGRSRLSLSWPDTVVVMMLGHDHC